MVVVFKLTVITQAAIQSSKLTSGTYSCPRNLFDVCSILTLGKQLSVCKCETVAKAHEIIAWLPMIDAAIAKINVGQNRAPEFSRTRSTSSFRTIIYIERCMY